MRVTSPTVSLAACGPVRGDSPVYVGWKGRFGHRPEVQDP